MSVEFPMLDLNPEFGEWCTREGAEALKARIASYWEDRGYPVQVWIEQRGFESALRGAHYVVRSNIVSGLPSPQRVERAA